MEPGESFKVSTLCNPNYKRYGIYTCEMIASWSDCERPVYDYVAYGNFNKTGFLETYLQCPECGCGPEGTPNLNDLYAAEQAGLREVSRVATIMLNPHE